MASPMKRGARRQPDHAPAAPQRHSLQGINVVVLWSASVTKGYTCPIWLTFKQALDLGGHGLKGETGELVVYADRITRTETDAKGGRPSAKSRSSKATPCSRSNSAKDCPRTTPPSRAFCPIAAAAP